MAVVANLAVAALGACGGNTEKPAVLSPKSEKNQESTVSAEQNEPRCSKAHRNGTYHVQLQGISSTCKQVAEYDEQLKDGIAPLEADCSFDKPDTWSKDGCSLQRMYTCKTDAGGTKRTILVSSQNSEDGSILAGILSIRTLDKSGSENCQGTFRFIASRK